MPDKEVGTPCEAFEEYFTLNPVGIPKIGNNTELDNFPILVRHFDVDEGKTEHYSVIIGRYMQGEESMLNMFDPWIGEERTVSEKKFLDSWHSEKYGNRWGLRLEI